MKFGYRGKILEIELNERLSIIKNLPEEDAIRFIGGAGLNAWILYQNIQPSIGATDPENPLVFGAGPLVGTSFPTSARSSFTALSPLTGIFGDSNGGGHLGLLVKSAGYDHLIIKGISDKPCYIVIMPNGVCSIEDAEDLWGRDTLETETILKQRHPGSMVASIGPAGENLVRFASIQFDQNRHSFSRAGMGAVMGSKNLKAIVVQSRGGGSIQVKDPQAINRIAQTIKQYAKKLAFPKLFRRYGTPMFINIIQSLELLYGENWRRKIRDEDIERLDIGAYYDAAESKSYGCFRCPLSCGKQWRIKHGKYMGEQGPKYEVAYILTLGLTLGLKDVPTILHLVNKLNLMGLDINEFSGALGMATDAMREKMLSKDMADGLDLRFGNAEAYESVIELIAQRRGVGDILAEGTKKAAEKIGGGAEAYALHMKGMHWPAHSAPPFVMAFSVSTRGGDFLKAIPHLILQSTNDKTCKKLFDAEPETMNIYSHAKKGRAVWWHENYKLLIDSLGVCFYLGQTLLTHGRLLPEELAEAYSAATGVDADGKVLLKAAERANQIERAINSLRGHDRKQDTFTKRPERDSWAQGIDLNRSGMLDEYYAYRGLSQRGFLTQERLLNAELPEIVQDLAKEDLIDHCSDSKDSLTLDKIIKNPSPQDFNRSLKTRVQNKLKGHIMGKLSEDPLKYREHFKRIGLNV